MTLHREVATQAADRPHPFDGAGNCDVCAQERGHELHTAYETVAAASRETAAEQRRTLNRELGTS
jgi:hypothetical protein